MKVIRIHRKNNIYISKNRKHNKITKARGKFWEKYKVLIQKDKWFSGKFNPQTLEINSYAEQGCTVAGCATAAFPSAFGAGRQEMVIILERDAKHGL